ncbi:hypothetical protein GCM10009549_30820 [Streptomyces thermoalcalitolerans]|uniref:Uncharacterized protein n=1 Tax=Streptomyces thermoalcalitolerans TaxID=65605 RepID=A0ABP3Z7X4_9ACTN
MARIEAKQVSPGGGQAVTESRRRAVESKRFFPWGTPGDFAEKSGVAGLRSWCGRGPEPAPGRAPRSAEPPVKAPRAPPGKDGKGDGKEDGKGDGKGRKQPEKEEK